MFSKINAALLIVVLIFMASCGENLNDYQSEIVKKAESIIASNNENGLSSREVKILLTVLYIECVKLREYKNQGTSYDKLFTTFTNLIPTYHNLTRLKDEKRREYHTESLIKTAKALTDGSDKNIIELMDELEVEKQNLEMEIDVLKSDALERYNSLLLITTETQESSIWAKAKAKAYVQEFNNLIDAE